MEDHDVRNDPQSTVSRRQFLAASLVAGSAACTSAGAQEGPSRSPATAADSAAASWRRGPRMRIAELLPPAPEPLWQLARQCGVEDVVGTWGRAPEKGAPPWSYPALERLKKSYAQGGFRLGVIEARPPMTKTKLGLPGRDEEIETVCELVRNMGALDIPVWCYQWMALGVLRTADDLPSRGGALVTGYDHALAKEADLTEYGAVQDQQLWDSLEYFLRRVLPVAEKAGVKLAMHPDDPPLSPIRGVARIMRSIDSFQRLVDLLPSSANGITLCQGNFTLMTDDLPAVIRRFGEQKKIFFVHFRDVRGTPSKYQETFHDDGQTDMAACMRAYRDIGFDGVCRPDHVPTLVGDSNDKPGYSTIGRLFAIGYIKGLADAIYDDPVASG